VLDALRCHGGRTGDLAPDRLKEMFMATSTASMPDARVDDEDPTPATEAPSAVDSPEGERASSRREALLVAAVVALAAAVVLFGLVFPELLAPAVGIAVLAIIVALEWLLPSGELRPASAKSWRR
jgi:hypothetical protein